MDRQEPLAAPAGATGRESLEKASGDKPLPDVRESQRDLARARPLDQTVRAEV